MIYAVIDTNVLVSALLSKHSDAATVTVVSAISSNEICPIYNQEIIEEYTNVLNRPKFKFPIQAVKTILSTIKKTGIHVGRTKSNEPFPDPKDIVFYEVALSKDDSYLVTGNTRHFPNNPIVVTPTEMVDIMKQHGLL